MCLISYVPPDAEVSEQHLRNGLEVSDDGAGYALASDDGFMVSNRGMDGGHMLDEFLSFRARHPGFHGVFHSRLSTGTAAIGSNCHPFPVGGDQSVLLFHNGTLYPVPGTDRRCDSQVFADDRLMIGGDLDDPVAFAAADDYITSTGSKVLVITASGRYKETVYLFSRPQWVAAPGGVLHSNQDFLGKGPGWGEHVISGDLFRWRKLQDRQCHACGLYHDADAAHGSPLDVPGYPAFRNESARRRAVAAATEKALR